jgi:hypothetical protein
VTRSSPDVRVGIVGAGGIGRIHAENLREIDGARVSAVMDVSNERAEELASALGARAFTEIQAMLDEVDAVYVCSPPKFHREQVVAAVSAGKHVFCEKPLAATAENGRAIVDAVAAARVHAMVGFNNRLRPAFRRWRDLVREGVGMPLGAWIHRVAPSTPPPGDRAVGQHVRSSLLRSHDEERDQIDVVAYATVSSAERPSRRFASRRPGRSASWILRARSTTSSATSCGTTITPSSSATMRSPDRTVTPAQTIGSPSDAARSRPIGWAGDRSVQNAGVSWIVHS